MNLLNTPLHEVEADSKKAGRSSARPFL